jgi:hypothetical protein
VLLLLGTEDAMLLFFLYVKVVKFLDKLDRYFDGTKTWSDLA